MSTEAYAERLNDQDALHYFPYTRARTRLVERALNVFYRDRRRQR